MGVPVFLPSLSPTRTRRYGWGSVDRTQPNAVETVQLSRLLSYPGPGRQRVAAYEIGLLIIGIALFGTVVLPRLLEHRPLSFPIIYVALGFSLFALVPGTPVLDPVGNSYVTERLTELVVIISLMGAGLKIDRPFSLKRWSATWRLLAIALPLTAGIIALLAWQVLGLLPATAILLGAVIAPTDPVLASGIEAGAPLTELEEEQDPRFEWGQFGSRSPPRLASTTDWPSR